jgi:RimJ/RimL family protein N-acetyltransferase
MRYEPGERDSALQDLAAELAGLGRSANSVVLLAERADQVIGYVQLTGGTLRRSRATAYLVIGVLAHAAGRGTGTELLRQARAWAAARGLHRLELTVMAHNTRAIRLYERTGFTVEGRRSECLLVDGQFIDELTMAILLPSPQPPPLPRQPPPYPSPHHLLLTLRPTTSFRPVPIRGRSRGPVDRISGHISPSPQVLDCRGPEHPSEQVKWSTMMRGAGDAATRGDSFNSRRESEADRRLDGQTARLTHSFPFGTPLFAGVNARDNRGCYSSEA